MSEVKKKMESEHHYEYTSPGKLEGGEMVGPVAVPESEELPVIRDQLAPSAPRTDKSYKVPPIDAPDLPQPTAKAVRIAEVKRAVKELVKKNPWIANPSYLGYLLAIMFDVQKTLSETRFNESQMKQVIESSIFSLGMENADFAKQLKELAANKEFAQAIGAFINAGINIYHAASVLKSKGRAEKEVDESTEIGKTPLADQKTKIQQLEDKKALAPVGTDVQGADVPATLKKLKAEQDMEFDKQIKDEQGKLDKMSSERRETIREKIRTFEAYHQAGAEALKQTTTGAVSTYSGLMTLEEGKAEKLKGMNDALMQVFNKVDDGVNKAKDDLQSQLDKILQQISQTSSDMMKAHQIGRG